MKIETRKNSSKVILKGMRYSELQVRDVCLIFFNDQFLNFVVCFKLSSKALWAGRCWTFCRKLDWLGSQCFVKDVIFDGALDVT